MIPVAALITGADASLKAPLIDFSTIACELFLILTRVFVLLIIGVNPRSSEARKYNDI